MSDSPIEQRRPRSHEELLTAARQLPEPPLPEARREEMRTEFLATVRGLRSSKRAWALVARRRGKRLLVAASLLFAGASFAAAAWRITARLAPAPVPRVAADRTAGGAHRAAATPAPAKAEPEPVEAEPANQVPPDPSEADGHDRRQIRAHRRLAMTAPGTDASQAEAELAFARGWTALGAGNFAAAAEAFGRAAGSGSQNPLSEDACFWRAVAFDRAGRFGEAQRSFGEFLARYPRSDRTGEAAVMLGWLLLGAGDGAGAAARFASALDDPAERVRGSAQAGLAAASR